MINQNGNMDIKPVIQKAKKIKIKVIVVDERNYVNDLAMQLIRFLVSKGVVDGYMNILKILKSYVTSRSFKKIIIIIIMVIYHLAN
jgi:hypothetical protein